ncbi:histidine kinase dimerization/phospho-acceptor domain-containing protein [Ferrovum myxofaciens]
MRPPLVKSLLKAMIAILLTMIVLEVTKTYIFPKITILGSYIITITFSTLTGTVVSGYVLLKYEKLNQNLGNHILERERLASELQNLNEVLELKVQERSRQLLAAQDELARNDKLAVLGQVAGSVGHELRNPLGVMNNAVYFLQTVLSDADETTKEYLGIIKEEIAVSDRIVGDLLDSVRIKPPHPEAVGVGDLIGHVLRKCTIPENVTIVQEIPDGLPPLKADPLQIH